MTNYWRILNPDKVSGCIDGKHVPDEFRGFYDLLFAVLLTAVDDYFSVDHQARGTSRCFFENKEDGIFSFISICRYLNIRPELFLRGLRSLTKEQWFERKRRFLDVSWSPRSRKTIKNKSRNCCFDNNIKMEAFGVANERRQD